MAAKDNAKIEQIRRTGRWNIGGSRTLPAGLYKKVHHDYGYEFIQKHFPYRDHPRYEWQLLATWQCNQTGYHFRLLKDDWYTPIRYAVHVGFQDRGIEHTTKEIETDYFYGMSKFPQKSVPPKVLKVHERIITPPIGNTEQVPTLVIEQHIGEKPPVPRNVLPRVETVIALNELNEDRVPNENFFINNSDVDMTDVPRVHHNNNGSNALVIALSITCACIAIVIFAILMVWLIRRRRVNRPMDKDSLDIVRVDVEPVLTPHVVGERHKSLIQRFGIRLSDFEPVTKIKNVWIRLTEQQGGEREISRHSSADLFGKADETNQTNDGEATKETENTKSHSKEDGTP